MMRSVRCWERTDVARGCRAEPASRGEPEYHERDGYLDKPETDNLHQTVCPEQSRISLLFSSSAIRPSSSLTLHHQRNHQINQNTRLHQSAYLPKQTPIHLIPRIKETHRRKQNHPLLSAQPTHGPPPHPSNCANSSQANQQRDQAQRSDKGTYRRRGHTGCIDTHRWVFHCSGETESEGGSAAAQERGAYTVLFLQGCPRIWRAVAGET